MSESTSLAIQTKLPVLNSDWQWQLWDGKPYLRCRLLQPWQHGFFTRQFAPALPDTLVTHLSPTAIAYRARQVHGNTVLTPTQIAAWAGEEELPPGDALVSDGPDQGVWAASADCTPLLIGDLATGRVAAIHAGWRGTAARIVPETVNYLLTTGSSLSELRIAMGPAIAGEVYQVAEEVAATVGASLFSAPPSPEAIFRYLWELPDSPLLPDPEPDRVRLDVRRINALQLQQLGLPPGQMAIAPCCTYQQPDYFFSYRRQPQKQVQWSGIVSPGLN